MCRSEEQRASRASSRKCRTFDAVFRDAPEAILIVSLSECDFGQIVACNGVCESAYGFSINAMVGRSLAVIDAFGDSCVLLEEFTRMKKGEAMRARVRHIRNDGSTFPAEISASSSTFGGGECVILQVRDVSRKVELEEALHLASERLSLALSLSCDGFWDWDVNNGQVFFDNRCYEMAGYQPGEFPATFREWESRVHSEDLGDFRSILEIFVTGDHEVYDWEFRFMTGTGDWIWIRTRARALGLNGYGSPSRVIGINRDITPDKRVEMGLRSADLAKTEFLSVMSHELRTPLNPIFGFVEILRQGGGEEDVLELLNLIDSGAQRMLDLVSMILMYVDLDERQLQSKHDLVDVQSLMEGIVGAYRNKAETKGVSIEMEVSDSIRSRIAVNEQKLVIAIGQMVANAVKFTDEGRVKVSASLVPSQKCGANLSIHVRDSGCGISVCDEWKVFAPLQQVDSSLTRRGEGIGLGLSLAKKILECMGGRISFESKVGVGSEFVASLSVELESEVKAKGPNSAKIVRLPSAEKS